MIGGIGSCQSGAFFFIWFAAVDCILFLALWLWRNLHLLLGFCLAEADSLTATKTSIRLNAFCGRHIQSALEEKGAERQTEESKKKVETRSKTSIERVLFNHKYLCVLQVNETETVVCCADLILICAVEQKNDYFFFDLNFLKRNCLAGFCPLHLSAPAKFLRSYFNRRKRPKQFANSQTTEKKNKSHHQSIATDILRLFAKRIKHQYNLSVYSIHRWFNEHQFRFPDKRWWWWLAINYLKEEEKNCDVRSAHVFFHH